MEDVPTAVAAEPAQVWVGSGHVVRQSFGERRQWGGSYGPRFCSVYPLPRAWRPKADSRLPANRFRFAPMSPTGILWSTSRKPTKHAEAWLAEMDGRWPFIRPGLNGNVVPMADVGERTHTRSISRYSWIAPRGRGSN